MPEHSQHRLFLFGTTVAVFAMFVAIALGLAILVTRWATPAYDPLIFPIAHNASPSMVIVGKTSAVTISTLRCNTSPEAVTYKAVKSWVSIDPPGTTVFVATTIETQPSGCIENVSYQPVPDEVISRSTALSETTHRPVTWEVEATDIPLHHLHAVSVTWASTPIIVETVP